MQRTGAGQSRVHLQLAPGETVIVQFYNNRVQAESYPYWKKTDLTFTPTGSVQLQFLTGGPLLPEKQELEQACLWTDLPGESFSSFSGTARYTFSFGALPGEAEAWLLDLGEVRESARVWMNGEELATLVGPVYRVIVPASALSDQNLLEVDVTNLMANRISDLERKGVAWKKFYNINFPTRRPENRGPDGLFTAAHWDVLPSGLGGPVRFTALERYNP